MDSIAVLETRVISLLLELESAKGTIAGITGDKVAAVRSRLAASADAPLGPLANLRISLSASAASASLPVNWQNYDNRRQDCAELFDECLYVLQGIALRAKGWDNGVCRIADRLLTDLANRAGMDWDRVTLIGAGEQYRSIPGVIWIRYPVAAIWDLPVAVHELGHYLGPRLEKEQTGKTTRPLQNLLDGVKDPTAQTFLQEHLGDVFATYVLGPAYAAACLLVRFDPQAANVDGKEHPSPAKRAYAILKTLEALDGGAKSEFWSIASRLRGVWNATLTNLGQQASLKDFLGPAGFTQFDDWATLLGKKVDERLSAMRYGAEDLNRCRGLAVALQGSAALPVADGYSIADVINAAWLARAADMDLGNKTTAHLGRRAMEMCTLLAQ